MICDASQSLVVTQLGLETLLSSWPRNLTTSHLSIHSSHQRVHIL